MKTCIFSLAAILALNVLFAIPVQAAQAPGRAPQAPRLILQLTVDQLRGDMLPRYRDRFGAGGFRRLMDQGLYYTNASYGTGNTFTASGHAVLVTGADTAEHGMVANEWFDRASGKVMYATFDAQYGMSPTNLTSTTFGDELVSATAGRSRAFSVAGKDRSAIIPAGHLGKAFWLSDSGAGFISSPFYYQALPAWTQAWNDHKLLQAFRGKAWQPLRDTALYLNARNAANSYARPNTGVSFPHVLDAQEDKKFVAAFRATPFLDEYTLTFAKELIRREKVGQGEVTDYLAISLSGTDYVGHYYGPNSLEYEDNLLRLDATVAGFLSFLDTAIGKNRVLVVLSADHGVDDIPEASHAQSFDAERFYPKKLLEQMNAALKSQFGGAEGLIAAFSPPGFYLDLNRIESLKLDQVAVEKALAEALRSVPGVAYALTRSDLLAGRVARTVLLDKVQRSFHPQRSGDVVIVQKQLWYLYHDPEGFAAMHGSPYSYDTFVPVIFMGPGIGAAKVARPVEPAGIAPTLSALMRIKPPSGSSASPLNEALNPRP